MWRGTARADGWLDPLEPINPRSKHKKRQGIKICRREGFSPRYQTPHSPGAGVRIHTLTHGHTQRHAHTPTHAGPRVPALTHTPSDAHTLLTPSPARHFLGPGGGGGPPRSVLKGAPLRLPAPTKLLFFVAVSSVRVFTSSQS